MKVLPSPPFDWVYSPLGGPQSTFQHSIAIDAQAHGNVVYFDATSGHPFYAKSDGTNWTIVAVPDQIGGTNTPWPNAPSGTQGIQPSIVIDGLGHVHLAYYAVTSWPNSQLHYAMFDGTNWTIENVATVGVVDGGCSIAVNGAGVPFIAYNNGTAGGRNIAIVSRQGGTWATFGPAIGATGPQSIGAKFDASGNLFLAFTDQNGARIAVHRMTSSTNTLILSRSGNFRAVSLAVESGGVVHLAYSASSATPGAQTLTYDRWSGSAWLAVPEVADATLGTVEGLSIAAFMNSPQIAYAGNGVLKYANKTLGAWYHDAIDPSGDMTGPVSLALGGSGERWISYADRAGKTYRVSSPMTNGGGGDPCNPCDPCDPCEILPAIRSVTLTGPNPVHVGRPITFRIQTPGPMTFDVGLFDVAGRRVAGRESQQVRAGVETVQWTPNSIRAGIYFLRVRSEAGTELATRLMVLD
jgi:hypothetical protein